MTFRYRYKFLCVFEYELVHIVDLRSVYNSTGTDNAVDVDFCV